MELIPARGFFAAAAGALPSTLVAAVVVFRSGERDCCVALAPTCPVGSESNAKASSILYAAFRTAACMEGTRRGGRARDARAGEYEGPHGF